MLHDTVPCVQKAESVEKLATAATVYYTMHGQLLRRTVNNGPNRVEELSGRKGPIATRGAALVLMSARIGWGLLQRWIAPMSAA